MKKSRRYFRNTFVTLAAAVVVMIAANRFYTPAASAYVPERSSVADLAALRDFTAIRVEGDFALEVQEQSTFAVSYDPASEKHGEFSAQLKGNTLVLTGYGNHPENGISTVRVGLPVLQRLSANGVPTVTVSNVSSTGHEAAELRISDTGTVKLLNNSAPLHLSAYEVKAVELDKGSTANTTLQIMGNTTVKHLQE